MISLVSHMNFQGFHVIFLGFQPIFLVFDVIFWFLTLFSDFGRDFPIVWTMFSDVCFFDLAALFFCVWGVWGFGFFDPRLGN